MNKLSVLGCLSASLVLVPFFALPSQAADSRPNVLIVTVDDMSADSLGSFGCKLPETSPAIDAFARQSLRFQHAHVLVGNCMPGRNIMWSGLYSHVNGVEGFVQNTTPDYPVLCDLAKQAGYFAAIRGKVSHSTPYSPYAWDAVLDADNNGKKYATKDAAGYGESTRRGIEMADAAGKPFCLMVNISDPHKPFYAQGRNGQTVPDQHVPSKVFSADEVPVPGFLPDDEAIRKELAHYYSSVRRADDCFAAIMSALEQSGKSDETFVMFLSDHGMPLPFAKTQLYYHSTRTPLMVRWPGVTEPNSTDDEHVVSAVDFVPTLMDVMQHQHPSPQRLHGRSFAPLLTGKAQSDRDFVILQYNENSGRNRHPMRGISTTDRLYLYNAWPDGVRKFATATTGTVTYRQMVKRAASEPDIAARLQLFDHRVVEEFYDIKNDPDCLVNLIDSEEHSHEIDALRSQLAESLAAMNDPIAPLVAAVDDAEMREAYMRAEDERVERVKAEQRERKKAAAEKQRGNAQRTPNKTSNHAKANLVRELSIQAPESATAGQPCGVVVHFDLDKTLGPQKIQVTIKTALDKASAQKRPAGQRIERKIMTIEGAGQRTIDFDIPAATTADAVSFAAFIGESFQTNLKYITTDSIRLAHETAANN
tara:strand:- start:72225 stop:74168 length:1944 start_codon:yes stop_codon:yes gene_type:complete